MNAETQSLVESLRPKNLDVLEVSGASWGGRAGFRSYASTSFPSYDLCAGPLEPSAFDLVIVEQVLEHVRKPARAVENALAMLRPGGHLLVTTPFLIRVHGAPSDFTRWTEPGLRHLLEDGGFDPTTMRSGSWGNAACVRANLRSWRHFRSAVLQSLENDPLLPMVVWALARRPG